MKEGLSDVDFKNVVVLLIDMQDHFINNKTEREKLIPNHISILNFCCENNIPVIEIVYDQKGETTAVLGEVLKKIPGQNLYTIKKPSCNAFANTHLKDILARLQARTLLLMGIFLCDCIFYTALEAKKLGYKLVTSESLIAGICNDCRKKVGVEALNRWYKKNGYFPADYKLILERIEQRTN